MNQIVEHSDLVAATAPAAQETHAIMAVIERIALNKDADIDKLEKMLDMQERILDRNAKQAFTASLALMQMSLPRIAERGTGHNDKKYALLEDINDQVRPTLHAHGFAITFRIKHEGPSIQITTVLSHRDGHSEETTISLPSDNSGGKNAVQAVGSTISYGKRYGLCALLNISTGDDSDGYAQSTPDTLISADQLAELVTAMSAKGITTEKFCQKMRVKQVAELETVRFQLAMDMIKKTGVPKQ